MKDDPNWKQQSPAGVLAPAVGSASSPPEVKPSERVARVRYAIRDVLVVAEEARAAGKRLIPLNIGDPIQFDFRTPDHVIEATYRAMLDGHTGYAPSLGIPEAVEAIRAEAARQGIQNVQEVYVTSGVSEAIEATVSSLLSPGENLLIPAPGYPLFEGALAKLGFEPRLSTTLKFSFLGIWEPT